MYISLMPTIFTGILTMIWCKLPILAALNIPIDKEKRLSDGKRLFGQNKTWKGLLGYLLLGAVSSIVWGALCQSLPYLEARNYFYVYQQNTFSFNLATGLLLGLAYALFELPNSFLKRRLAIEEGKTASRGRLKKAFFIFLDQADSLFGCVLVLACFYPMTPIFYLSYVLISAGTHLLLNILLYLAHLRRNIF